MSERFDGIDAINLAEDVGYHASMRYRKGCTQDLSWGYDTCLVLSDRNSTCNSAYIQAALSVASAIREDITDASVLSPAPTASRGVL